MAGIINISIRGKYKDERSNLDNIKGNGRN